jgi:hypothetical protein
MIHSGSDMSPGFLPSGDHQSCRSPDVTEDSKEHLMALTGRFDFRRTMTGHLQLWVEYGANSFWCFLT